MIFPFNKDWEAIIKNIKKRDYSAFSLSIARKIESLNLFDRTNVVDGEKWDNLIVIDGCRYDLAEDELDFKPRKIRSIGSSSEEWAKQFNSDDYEDIIYISSNPHISNHKMISWFGFQPFHKICEVFRDGWNEQLGTVEPEEVLKKFQEEKSKNPDKRFILHFMQPHHPFIGDNSIDETGWLDANPESEGDEKEKVTAWNMLERGQISKERVWAGYKGNLKLVLEKIKEYSDDFKGETLITSDHGNLIGEIGLYAHPQAAYHPKLVNVPLFNLEELKNNY